MAQFYTKSELCEMLQGYLGVKLGTDNKRFGYDRCWQAIAAAIEQWIPWLPADMQSNSTERTKYAEIWVGNGSSSCRIHPLPAEVSRLLSVRPLTGEVHVELYGLDPGDPNGCGDKRAFDDRCAWLRRTSGMRLFCLVGKTLQTYPTPTADFTFDLTYRAYLDEPSSDDTPVQVEKNAVPFLMSAASFSGKLGDLRVQEALALQGEFITTLKTVFGIKDRENVAGSR
jgi:hypothetical protein